VTIDHLTAAEHEVRTRYGDALDDVLDIAPRPKHLDLLDSLRSADPKLGIEVPVRTMLDYSVPGGLLDPSIIGSDVPWVRLVAHVAVTDTGIASATARRLSAHLFGMGCDGVKVSAVNHAVADFMVAAVENLRGRPKVAERWQLSGHAIADYEDARPGLGIACYLRAMRTMTVPYVISIPAWLSS
jgi:hypothetical protein